MAPSCWTSIAAGWTQRSVSCKPVGAGVPPVRVGVASWAGVRYILSQMGPVQRSAVLAARSRGPAVWEVHEQVAIAAMEAGCKELALRLVKNVNKRFPFGTRGSRLTVGCPVLQGGRNAYNAASVCVSTWVGWGEPLHVACHVPGQQRSIAYVCTCMAAAGPGRCCSSPLLGAGRAASWPGRPILAPCAPLGRQGMYFELLGSFVEAEQLYQKELDNDPTNAMVLKRMVSSQAPACVPHNVAARKHDVSTYSCDCGEFGMDNEKWTWPHWRARCALRGLLRAPGVPGAG